MSEHSPGVAGSPYAAPIAVASLSECYYYHTMDVPGHGLVEGEWDLRGGVDAYLGHEPVAGKRVLEIGTASGFLCFEMERRGADVVAFDLGANDPWDMVPFARSDVGATAADRSDHMARINRSWWFNHRAFGSKTRMVYGSVYAIPASIGTVDVCTFGAMLVHVRDPFLALQRAAALAPATIVVTELAPRRRALKILESAARRRSPLFLPDALTGTPLDAWWSFSPEAMSNMLGVLGYRTERVVRHAPLYRKRPTPMFTLVARRSVKA